MSASCVLYVRVSTTAQGESGTSLADQLAACQAKAQQLNLPVVAVCDDVQSGADLLRPGLQKALGILESGTADTLICYDLSRYSRDSEHQQAIRKRISRAGGKLVLCTLDIGDGTSPESALTFGVSGVFAEYERLKTRERTMKGRIARARQGVQPCRTWAPYGYHIVTRQDVMRGDYSLEQLGQYIIVEEHAAVVRELYRRFNAGASLRGLVLWLHEQGIAAPRGGRQWQFAVVRQILSNTANVGRAVYGRKRTLTDESRIAAGLGKSYPVPNAAADIIIIPCPAIVDEATFNAAQKRLRENRLTMSGRPDRKYLLTGMVKCPFCGRGMQAIAGYDTVSRGRPAYKPAIYRCRYSTRHDTTHYCRGYQIRRDVLEAAVLERVRQATDSAKLLRAWEAARKPAADNTSEIARLQREAAKLSAKHNAVMQAQIRAIERGLDSSAYEDQLATLQAQQRTTAARIEALTVESHITPPAELRSRAERLAAAATEALRWLQDDSRTVAVKREALAALIESITPPATRTDTLAARLAIVWR